MSAEAELGELAPPLELTDTGGTIAGLPEAGAAAATIVVWTCNHCPYALAWHERIVTVADEYAARGVRALMVNSNDAERYPTDGPEPMRERVEREGWTIPYLWDETQEAAKAWGARVTPHVFVLDADLRLRYEGAPDADHRDPALAAQWLRGAVEAVLAGREPDPAATEPVGCSIKWKP